MLPRMSSAGFPRLRLSVAWRWSVCLVAVAGGLAFSWPGQAADTPPKTNEVDAAVAADLNLPPDFFRRVRQRSLLDRYAGEFHAMEVQVDPHPRPVAYNRDTNERVVRVVKPPETTARQRRLAGNDQPVRPMRGYLPPILDRAEIEVPITLPAAGLTPAQRQAAGIVTRSLARERVGPRHERHRSDCRGGA
jgi:hypothetical protein